MLLEAHIVLCHSDDGTRKTLLTVMISWMLRHITRKLGNFCFLDKVPLERAEKNFPLARLQAINHGGNRPLKICHWKQYKLLVDKVTVFYELACLIKVSTRLPFRRCYIRYIFIHFLQKHKKKAWQNFDLKLPKPTLPLFYLLLTKCQLNGLPILFIFPNKIFPVFLKICKVLSSLLWCACSQPLKRHKQINMQKAENR